MKMLRILPLILLISQAHAGINDFECEFRTSEGKWADIEIERSFRPGNRTTAKLIVDRGVPESFLVAKKHNRHSGRLEYWGMNFDLKIDLWPDQSPRYGRRYRANFRSFAVEGSRNYYYYVDCRYLGY
ncbi:MAG: hypothetical protein KC478_02590 [Bacteriovoracaceae bacterium]|nr:hypothetical protein [Bacteriovoracaceae bacterium]